MDKELSDFGLVPIKREGRSTTYESEDLNDIVHVQVKLKNMALDKAEEKDDGQGRIMGSST